MTDATDVRGVAGVRLAAWSVFGLLLVAEIACLQLHLPVAVGSIVSQTLIYLIPIILAVIGSSLLALRLRGVERWFWGVLAVAVTSIFLAESYWTWYTIAIDFRGPRVPHWVEIGHLVAIILFYVLVVSMTELGESPLFTRLRFYLDLLGALILAFAAVYWWWTLPLFIGLPMGGWPVAAVAAAYPVCATVILVTTGLIVLGWKAYRWRTWERLITLSFALYGVGLLAFPLLYAAWITAPVQQSFDLYSALLGFGLYLLFMAAIYRVTEGQDAEKARPWPVPRVGATWLPMLYPAVLATALVFMGLGAFRVAGRPGGMIIVVATALLAVVIIVRSWLGSVELAHHRARSITDVATGTFNQRYLYERLPIALADARAENREITAIAFDIVDFRDIVKMSGAAAGDRLLRALIDIIRAELPVGATVYRVGRDEIIAIVAGVSAPDAAGLARRVNARLGAEVSVEGIPAALAAGVAVFPQHAEDAESLVSRALASQQLARAAERPDVVVYDADVVEAADPLARLDRARRQSHRSKLRALAAAVDARDSDTRFHSESVAELMSAFALVLEMSEERTRTLEAAATMHDIGKIGIADEILLKPGPLTDDEWQDVHRHCELGERLLGPAEMPDVLPIVRHHHERWDGKGYPDGLSGPDIPVEARMLAICDAFEAMTTGRRWRPAMSTAQALEQVEQAAGTRFDPRLAETFARMVVRMHGRPIAGRMAASRRDIGLADG